jgi:hypothetical protein
MKKVLFPLLRERRCAISLGGVGEEDVVEHIASVFLEA